MDSNITNAADNAIYEYYALKSKYDGIVNKTIKKIREEDLTKKQKRRKFQQLKHKCLKCKRVVNTKFSTTDGKLKAVCGDSLNPCSLNIEIELAQTMDVKDTLSKLKFQKSTNQANIIKNKFDLLFGYISEENALETFNELMTDIKELNISITAVNSAFNEVTDEETHAKEVDELKITYYKYINTIKHNIKLFHTTSNYQHIIDIIELYQNDLQPIIAEIRNKQYSESYVLYDDNNFNLIQIPSNLINPTVLIKESKVISNKK